MMGHIPREISRHVYYFIKTKGGSVNGSVISTKYRPLPIPLGGLEIPLFLKFLCPEQKTFEKMKNFVDSLFMITITVELTTKKVVMKKKLQLSLKLISQSSLSHGD